MGCRSPRAFLNRELRETGYFRGLDENFRDGSGLRRPRFHFFEEGLDGFPFSLEMDLHAFFRVQHPALQTIRARKPIDERAEIRRPAPRRAP